MQKEAKMSVCTKVRDWTADDRADVDLVGRALAGDQAAESELLGKYRAIFLGWVCRTFRKGNRWTEDYAQEAAIKLHKVLIEYRPERSPFWSWAHIVAKTAIFTFISKQATERNDVSLDALMDDALPVLLGPEEEHIFLRVREEVENLAPEQRAAVRGPYYDGLSDDELALMLGLPRRRVCYRRRQGMAAIRERLSEVPFTTI
jgi:RNA polymerase sigma factor (sigma-70 family)